MEKVTGIGGIFFRAKDPEMLADWYEQNLGVGKTPDEYGVVGWRPNGGTTVFQPFDDDTDYFKNPEKQFMLNFRVANMDKMVEQLRKAGIDVTVQPEPEPNGRFAQLFDPEGNCIELWEPSGIDKETEEK